MSLFVVDEEKCIRCGACIAGCPAAIIEIKDGDSFPTPTDWADQLCISCGHCVAICPHGALSHRAMTLEQCPPVREEWFLSPEQAEHFLRARRSIRNYTDEAVKREVLAKLINIARFAPTGHNAQSVNWLVIQSSDEVQQLAGQVIDWMRHTVKENPPLAKSMYLSTIIRAWKAGADIICRRAPHLIITHAPEQDPIGPLNSIIALTYLELAAPAFGLGACWAGYLDIAAKLWPPIKQSLGLLEGHVTCATMMVGYPKYRYHRLPLRNEARITWH